MTNNSGRSTEELAQELLRRLRPLGFRMAVKFAAYPGIDHDSLEVDMFRVPDDLQVKIGLAAVELVIDAEEELGFTGTLVFPFGDDISEEYEASVVADAIASWTPEAPVSI